MTERVVHWELNGNKVHLRDNNYEVVADPKTPIAEAVDAANNNTIIMTFPVAAFAKDGDPVIEVTRLFTTDVPEFSARQRLGATTMDATRSFIERISPYPENIEAEATMTYTRTQMPAGMGTAAPVPTAVLGGGQMRPGSATIVLHHSMVKLPEKPMMPRVFDERVGYFTTSMMDYSKDEQRAPRVRYIDRWRLEKKDPQRRRFRAGEAHRLLHRRGHAREVARVAQEGRGRLAARFRSRRLQERHHCQDGAHARGRPRFQPRGRALLRHPLAALHH